MEVNANLAMSYSKQRRKHHSLSFWKELAKKFIDNTLSKDAVQERPAGMDLWRYVVVHEHEKKPNFAGRWIPKNKKCKKVKAQYQQG